MIAGAGARAGGDGVWLGQTNPVRKCTRRRRNMCPRNAIHDTSARSLSRAARKNGQTTARFLGNEVWNLAWAPTRASRRRVFCWTFTWKSTPTDIGKPGASCHDPVVPEGAS